MIEIIYKFIMFKSFSTLSFNIEYSIKQDKIIDIDIRCGRLANSFCLIIQLLSRIERHVTNTPYSNYGIPSNLNKI